MYKLVYVCTCVCVHKYIRRHLYIYRYMYVYCICGYVYTGVYMYMCVCVCTNIYAGTRVKLIATDGVFSMDGDVTPLGNSRESGAHNCPWGASSPRWLRLGLTIAHQLNEDGHDGSRSWRQGASDSGALARAHYFLGCLAIHSRASFCASAISSGVITSAVSSRSFGSTMLLIRLPVDGAARSQE